MTEASLARSRLQLRAGMKRLTAWEWLVAGLSVAMFAGAHLDAWAHVHVSAALETILTPWHFVVYASFAALGLTLASPVLARLVRGRPLTLAAPRSYRWALIGALVFVGAGGLDLLWHMAFGIEVGVEALLSPTHLGLAIGAGLLWTGPVTVAWRRRSGAVTLIQMLPALLSLAAIVGLAAFTTHFAHPLVDPWPIYGYSERDPETWFVPSVGFAAFVIQTAVLMGGALLLLRRWPTAPAGAFTVLFVVSSAGLPFLHDQPALVVIPLATGLLADGLSVGLRRLADRQAAFRVFAALVPLAMWLMYFVALLLTATVAWSAHLVVGSLVMSAATGLLVSLLVLPPGHSAATNR